MARHYTTEWTVSGQLTFPIDMLRYDACYPASQEDAAKLEEAMRPASMRESPRQPISITLRSQIGGPETARWSSFSWRVDQLSIKRR